MGSGSKVTVKVVETFETEGNLSTSLAETSNKDSFSIWYKPLSRPNHMGESKKNQYSTTYLKWKDLPSTAASPQGIASDHKSWIDLWDIVTDLASKVNFLVSENVKMCAKMKTM